MLKFMTNWFAHVKQIQDRRLLCVVAAAPGPRAPGLIDRDAGSRGGLAQDEAGGHPGRDGRAQEGPIRTLWPQHQPGDLNHVHSFNPCPICLPGHSELRHMCVCMCKEISSKGKKKKKKKRKIIYARYTITRICRLRASDFGIGIRNARSRTDCHLLMQHPPPLSPQHPDGMICSWLAYGKCAIVPLESRKQ